MGPSNASGPDASASTATLQVAGRWSLVGDQVSITTLASDGLLTSSPLGNLQVLEDGSEKRLLQLNDREFYDEWGPDSFSCFSRVE